MKKTVKFLLLLSPIFLYFFINQKIRINNNSEIKNNANVLSEKIDNSFEIKKIIYDNYEILISPKIDGENILLISNFNERKTARNIYEENNCKLLTNAGFYKNENNENLPIGLFVLDNKTKSNYEENKLFNSVFYINSFRTPIISKDFNSKDFVYAFQSGPLLIFNSLKIDLQYDNIKRARRMVLAITGDNKVILMALYSTKMVFDGPVLNDLSTLIEEINTTYNLEIADAINLDGGSASAFVSDQYSITESSLIGSAICVF